MGVKMKKYLKVRKLAGGATIKWLSPQYIQSIERELGQSH